MPPNNFNLQNFVLSLKQTVIMKTVRFIVFLCSFSFIVSSCSLFKPKYGCPSNGKNVGAEKLLDGSKVPKAKKFKA